eukprot:NODE_1998_length_2314_cov_10.673068.p1 GENE.NODE_1998_length_2314_cov_10.673068~~NODE_1998_length_2314_cov_10.673068.p1  ORF type:complete len:673 (+),score=182.72 NODE_1998_length_2314_cov_10.673068:242-2020(+)
MTYCSKERVGLRETRLKCEIDEMRSDQGEFRSNLQHAWWEGWICPHLRASRIMMTHLEAMSGRCYECLTHGEFVHLCKDALRTLIKKSHVLLCDCLDVSIAGHLDDELVMQSLREKIESIGKDVCTVTDKVNQLQMFGNEKNNNEKRYLSPSSIDEHCFSFAVCYSANEVCNFAREILDCSRVLKEESRRWNTLRYLGNNLLSCFDWKVITSPEHLNYIARSTTAILTCWLIGFLGFRKMIDSFSAGLASTAALLLSKHEGSAILNNLNRILGVVMGLVIGQMAYALLGWCHWLGYTLLSCAFLAYVAITLFVYFNSSVYMMIGCLMAAFGTQSFLQGCKDSGFISPTATLSAIVECVIAILVLTIVDLTFSREKPSQKAFAELIDVLKDLVKALDDLFSREETKKELPGGFKSKARLLNVEALLDHSKNESRYWRRPFQETIFRKALLCTRNARLNLRCLYFVVYTQDPKTEHRKEKWFLKNIDAFQTLWDMVRMNLDRTLCELEILQRANTTSSKLIADDVFKGGTTDPLLHDAKFTELVDTMCRGLIQSEEPCNNLTDDMASQASYVVSCLTAIKDSSHKFTASLIKRL